ncbi:MAG: NTP transferase domain-containing protein [Candidatus Omnitrophica bacterium]|nr:NTP transferase domain-containing protein [Candidatus Omnitrophota bacterium]
MKALITCAGMGTRLGLLTENNNKALVELSDGRSIIEVMFDILDKKGIEEKVVVTGHYFNKVEDVLKGKATTVYNPFYQISGILASIWFARQHLEGKEFIFVTSDSIFHPSVLEVCMKSKADIAVCIEKKSCDAEDSKVVIKNDQILDIGKDIPINEASGEFIGMLKFSAAASKAFFAEVDAVLKESKLNSYVADVLLRLREKGLKLEPCYTETLPRIEIDYPEDLEKGRQIFRDYIKSEL